MPSALVHISHPRIMAVQEITFCIGILLNTLQAPTFCIHVNEAAAHKDIILATILVDQLFNVPASSSAATLAEVFRIQQR